MPPIALADAGALFYWGGANARMVEMKYPVLVWLVMLAGHAPAQSGVHAEALFHEKGCEHCHGPNFAGIEDKGPSLLTVGQRLKKDAIKRQIHDGGRVMPAFGESLATDEISALADMLARMKKAPKGSGSSTR